MIFKQVNFYFNIIDKTVLDALIAEILKESNSIAEGDRVLLISVARGKSGEAEAGIQTGEQTEVPVEHGTPK